MDTLPEEVVELIAQHLSPLDMTRCSAVSRSWYEVFNLDRLWKRHCDVDLEEPLQVIPNVATPSLDLSATEDSTLPLTSYWKMVYFREKQLWKSWRTTKIKHQLKEENIIKYDHENPLQVDFLTDTLIVAWYRHHIEILDVSVKPVIIATVKTEITEEIGKSGNNYVVGSNTLLVEKEYSIQVFVVDILNKSIKLKHDLFFKYDYFDRKGCIAKENFYLYIDEDKSNLKILDLNTGTVVKYELCPVELDQNVRVAVESIISSPTSDFVAVIFRLFNGHYFYIREKKLFIYSLNQLTFLPDPQISLLFTVDISQTIALDGNWIAVLGRFLNIFNISPTGELVLSDKISISKSAIVRVCSSSFVCVSYNFSRQCSISQIAIYFPPSKSWKVITEVLGRCGFKIINNKFITMFDPVMRNSLSTVWQLSSGQKIEKCDYSVTRHCKINKSFTKMINRQDRYPSQYCWYISHMW